MIGVDHFITGLRVSSNYLSSHGAKLAETLVRTDTGEEVEEPADDIGRYAIGSRLNHESVALIQSNSLIARTTVTLVEVNSIYEQIMDKLEGMDYLADDAANNVLTGNSERAVSDAQFQTLKEEARDLVRSNDFDQRYLIGEDDGTDIAPGTLPVVTTGPSAFYISAGTSVIFRADRYPVEIYHANLDTLAYGLTGSDLSDPTEASTALSLVEEAIENLDWAEHHLRGELDALNVGAGPSAQGMSDDFALADVEIRSNDFFSDLGDIYTLVTRLDVGNEMLGRYSESGWNSFDDMSDIAIPSLPGLLTSGLDDRINAMLSEAGYHVDTRNTQGPYGLGPAWNNGMQKNWSTGWQPAWQNEAAGQTLSLFSMEDYIGTEIDDEA